MLQEWTLTVIVSLMVGLVGLLPAAAQEAFLLQGTWWQEPTQQTRHATFVASFDSIDNNDADYSLDGKLVPEQVPEAVAADTSGLHGSAMEVAELGGGLTFPCASGFQGLHGTVRMQVKGEAFSSDKPFWLFDTRAADRSSFGIRRIGVKYENGMLSLVFASRWYNPRLDVMKTLDLQVGDVSTNEWHSVVASWDRDSETGWIALDGEGVSGPIEFSPITAPAYALFIGGSALTVEIGGMTPPGLAIDDFVLYDLPLPTLAAEPLNQLTAEDIELLPQAEAAARKTLGLLASLQDGGGWNWAYTWPNLFPTSGTVRDGLYPRNFYINDDKGNSSTAVVQDFTYGYDVLGDHRYVEVVTNMADLLVAGQQPGGYWSYGYNITPAGVQPKNLNIGAVKLQDHDQSYPLFLLCYAYRITGEQRYQDAALRAGEFYLHIQNPNGSYSHHYDPETDMGRTHTDLPQGGELNDGATNDAIDVLVLMYHFTKDPAYIRALKRVGDWLIEAQGREIPLWADQYDQDNNPIFARHFEPPAYGWQGTTAALDALVDMYRFSHDERYLEPIRKTIAWVQENLPDGMMPFYLELGTGRPIASWSEQGHPSSAKTYYLDNPDDLAYLHSIKYGLGTWTFSKNNILEVAQTGLKSALQPGPVLRDISVETAVADLPTAREQAKVVMATQDEAGLWLRQPKDTFMVGEYAWAVCWEVRTILRYVEVARMVTGELPAIRRGYSDPLATAYPYQDRYDVNWDQIIR